MAEPRATDILLIRHAPVVDPGRLAGRRDVAADVSDVATARAVAAFCGTPDRIITSPAQRTRQTAAALWPDQATTQDARLWEQSFGTWEGLPYADLPDLGPQSARDLAAHAPPEGESFLNVADRVAPALRDIGAIGGRVAVVAHAGVIRACLGLALEQVPQGLKFAVGHWSVTHLRAMGDAPLAIACVNWNPSDPA